jgi:membrane-bound lytic murein transglycosylase C
MMKNVIVICAFIAGFFGAAESQNKSKDEEFEKFKKEEQQGVQNEDQKFLQYKADVTKQFNDYVSEQEKRFREYTGQIEKKWGSKNVQTSTKKEYVAYGSSYGSRQSIDFEKGTAKVELLLSEKEAKDPALVKEKLREQIKEMVTSKGGEDPLELKNNIAPESTPLLEGQIQTKDGKPVTASSAQRFADQTVQSSSVTQQVVEGKDGIKRVVVGVQLPLVPGHVKKRAVEFKEEVLQDAKKFGIDPTLIFAVMHTESYFNPMAKSSVPAYGLMQLVPRSGARDAYLFVYKSDTLVTGEYLFVAVNNIELGAGYLAKLLTVDFAGIKDPKSRIYCAIAAYNTGPGNVAKSFCGKRSVPAALPKINAMSADEVIDFLKKNLPYEETRTYIGTVSQRMGMYNEWANN